VATWDDVRDVALGLPGVVEERGHDGTRSWRVRKGMVVWERPLRRADLEHLGDAAPHGDVLGARVEDEGAKWSLVQDRPDVYFTTPHFDGYPAVLARLDAMTVDDVREVVTEAWLNRASATQRREYEAREQ
jgi:hypothetical protein